MYKTRPYLCEYFINKLETDMLDKFKLTLPDFWNRYIYDIMSIY